MTVEDAGAPPAENGEFWLFGYGYVQLTSTLKYQFNNLCDPSSDISLQKLNLEAAATLWYAYLASSRPKRRDASRLTSASCVKDRRIPGWVNGYVRRFWQVC